ncbi:MAG: CoA transferase, partial [Acidimicrobiia bacterium]|nr:CoA transferase [Acidimicrobiia bacterium]
DGHINLAVVTDRHFAAACRLLKLEHFLDEDRFIDNTSRLTNRDSLAEGLQSVLATESTDHWMSLLGDAGLAVGRVLDFQSVFTDPQVVHNRMVVEVEHPVAGKVMLTGSPLHVDGEPARATDPPPVLGADSRRILRSAGLSDDRISELLSEGAVAIGSSP